MKVPSAVVVVLYVGSSVAVVMGGLWFFQFIDDDVPAVASVKGPKVTVVEQALVDSVEVVYLIDISKSLEARQAVSGNRQAVELWTAPQAEFEKTFFELYFRHRRIWEDQHLGWQVAQEEIMRNSTMFVDGGSTSVVIPFLSGVRVTYIKGERFPPS